MRLSHNNGKIPTDKENNMAGFIGPKEKLTVAQAAARRKKIADAKRIMDKYEEASYARRDLATSGKAPTVAKPTRAKSTRAERMQASIARAKLKAPIPLMSTQTGRMIIERERGKAKAPVPKAEVRAAAEKASTVAKPTAKKLTAGGVAKAIGKGAKQAITGKVGLGIAAATLLAGPIHKALSKDTKGRTTYDMIKSGKPYGRGRQEKMEKASYGRAVPGGLTAKPESKTPASKKNFKPPTKPDTKISSGRYRVEHHDTLSDIAKRAGVTLAELRAANPKIKDPRKIFRNTPVTIPKGGTKPSPQYTGPVPYRPGSKAAADYEASRKKK